jgi:hypothetical protein
LGLQDWERTNNATSDFMTLLRQTVNIVLAFQGIISREFISRDGHFIVTVCFGHEYNLKKVYEYLQLNKFLDTSVIDLLSFEPLDSKKRPLRLHKTLHNKEFWDFYYGTGYDDLFFNINKKMKEINLKKIVREFNGIWDNDMVKEENSHMQIYQHADVPIKMWENFLIFLTNLEERVKKIRLEYLQEKHKVLLKYHSKYSNRTDFGLLMKRLTEKTHKDDYFHINNIQKYLQNKLNGKDIWTLSRVHKDFINEILVALILKIQMSKKKTRNSRET